jgi:hypothetical protein
VVVYKNDEMIKPTKQVPILSGWLIVFTVLLMFSSCKPDVTGELGEPFDKIKGMVGTWQLAAFTQQDLNSPVQEVRDLSLFYTDGMVTPMQITFNENRAYSVAIELGKNYFGEGGTWGFDDESYPSFLQLYTSTDTLEYNLGSMVRVFDESMRIEYRRSCVNTPTNIYTFEFNRLN